MKKIIFLILAVSLIFTGCSVDMDSDYAIEQALIGDWKSSDGRYAFSFTTTSNAKMFVDNRVFYDGTYHVSERVLFINDPPYVALSFKVNSLTSKKATITGTGRYSNKYGVIDLIRQ